ncbi:cobalt-precorrin-5B (C(1))-methyltransferase CbiD [uncultured Eubacterium sp.]|uniref:cobalt-precorrin-5B (C(1))-methyltransferase CbiD n=1 Tax=uncultured Eubacterium sp. TaxID=165185 RepID=UPI0025D5EACE|nr:cobalt-precorrin-5B (C(1))-methyltransferase CbiD [uncultured Eubacterium sp.]
MKNGLEEYFVIKDNKKMRFGYTTGSCAAAAAKAAATMLFAKEELPVVELLTPKGIRIWLEVLDVKRGQDIVSCAIRKDGGDDPDVTNGILVYAYVSLCEVEAAKRLKKVFLHAGSECGEKKYFDEKQKHLKEKNAVVGITAGTGVGTITLPGLEQPIGAPAINKVPRSMIEKEVQAVCEKYGYSGGISVCICVPEGADTAKRTFNPRLGILGGISILGTSGIVEPMSEKALISSIEVEMKQKASGGKQYLLIAPGNYGLQYLSGHFPFEAEEAVKCSNYVGQTIDFAVNMGLKGILFVAHIGKFIKVAGGIMNTHSRDADARMEIMAACALRAGADAKTANQILSAVTTDEGLAILKQTLFWEKTLQIITEKVEYYLNHRAQGQLQIGAVLYSNAMGELGRTDRAEELLECLLAER